MRKRLIDSTPESIRTRGEGWLDIETAAVVEVTSEDPDCPVESAFVSRDERGWRAAALGNQRFGWSSISRKGSSAYRLCSRRTKLPARRSSFCGGLQMAEDPLKKLCDSNGISVHLTRYARSKNIKSSFQALPYLNWSSIRISAAESLAPHLRISVCLDANLSRTASV